MIEKSQDHYQVIKYDGDVAPELLNVPKSYIRNLLFLFFISVTLFLTLSFIYGIKIFVSDFKKIDFTQLKTTVSPQEQLENEIKTVTNENKILIQKLNSKPSTAVNDTIKDVQWGLLEIPYAMKDLRTQKKIKLESFELTQNSTEIAFQFNIVNNGAETEKVQGYFWVAMVHGTQLFYYPFANEWAGDIGLKFTQGETFGVSRLRPVKTPFSKKLEMKQVRFIIYIFTREGDLLHYQLSEPYVI
jgi:hypothetical protein